LPRPIADGAAADDRVLVIESRISKCTVTATLNGAVLRDPAEKAD